MIGVAARAATPVGSRRSNVVAALAVLRLVGLGLAISTVNSTALAARSDRFSGPFGRGAAEVWVLQPGRTIRDVVVFGHGWKVAPPSANYPWVGQFRPWLNHLLAGGSAVIFPRYQLGTSDPDNAQRVRDFATGIRVGYARLGSPKVPFVAVGYSFGASLAFYYAANARRWHLPQPRAVDAIFPAELIPGASLPTLQSSTRVLIQVGDADTEAGNSGAEQFWHWLSHHPASRKRYQLVHSTTAFRANHAAPKTTTAEARAAFWAPLDRLIRTISSRA